MAARFTLCPLAFALRPLLQTRNRKFVYRLTQADSVIQSATQALPFAVYYSPNKWVWTVKKGNNQEVTIADYLAVQDKWLAIIQETIDQLLKAQENEG